MVLEYTEYIHGLDPDAGSLVMGYRLRAQEQVDGVEEGMSYGMPALRYRDARSSRSSRRKRGSRSSRSARRSSPPR